MSGEKRSQDREDTLLEETTIIVDIEGTTTSIGFVKETLFPYIRENLKQYVEKNWEIEEFKDDLAKLKEQAKKDETDKVEGFIAITDASPEEERDTVVKNVLWQMDGDRKTVALKQLQGHVWREGYKSGAIKGHVYEDVPKAFDSWTKSGRKIYVYSSGSVEAQKLLFGNSEHGDMLKYFTGYFDTEVGPKQEASSYKNILAKIDAVPPSVLFLTDIVKEAEAAKEAGITANIVIRPGNASLTDEEKVKFATIQSFTDLSFQISTKRQKLEKPTDEKDASKTDPESTVSEPMDTSEVASATTTTTTATTTVESTTEKTVVKIDDTSKSVDAETVEADKKIAEKTDTTTTTMEIDDNTETDKKTTETIEKVVTVVEKKIIEEESKINENKGETAKNDKPREEKIDNDKKIANNDETEIVKTETTKVAAKDESSSSSVAKLTKDTTEEAKKPIESTTKTEIAKIVDESKTNDVKDSSSPSKSDTCASTTEEKTEEAAKKSLETIKPETTITETETKITDKTPKITANEEKTVASVSNQPQETSKETPATVETKIDPKIDEKNVEKSDSKVSAKTMEKEMVANADDKMAASTTDVKQNGDPAATAATNDESTVGKTESNGPSIVETAITDATVAETKIKSPTDATDGNVESTADNANKNDKDDDNAKSDDKTIAETSDAKLNGNSQNGNETTAKTTTSGDNDEPHRNGLNGDSSIEKTNGDAKTETTTQNGETTESSGKVEASVAATTTAESIKVKKVVDSTIADGAGGETDVVPPVAVVATS